MSKTLAEMMAEISPERRARITRRAKEMLREMGLSESAEKHNEDIQNEEVSHDDGRD